MKLSISNIKAQLVHFSNLDSKTPLLLKSTKFRSVLNQMKLILSEGRGAAFHAIPYKGVIKPWGEVEIKVNSYNNLVGIYTDEMVCEVEDITKTFQVRLGVVGTPVKVSGAQLISREKEVQRGGIDVEKVNFGARIINPAFGISDGVRIHLRQGRTQLDKHKTSSVRSSQGNAMAMIPNSFSKVIQVDNNSPRDVVLEWKVYIKHSPLAHSFITSTTTPLPSETPDIKIVLDLPEKVNDPPRSPIGGRPTDQTEAVTVDMIVKPENLVEAGDTGIFEVSPAFMTIPAFKSAPLKCSYRNAYLGSYEALIMADVAYVQKDGTYKYAPKRSKKVGEWPIEAPISETMLKSGKVTLEDLESVAVFGIKAKCIEPKLTLDGGDKIRIKRSKQIDHVQKKCVIAFINNRSDAICEFTLSATPSSIFKVKGSKKHIKGPQDAKKQELVYELKQTQQLMITVEYSGQGWDGSHDSLSNRESQVGRDSVGAKSKPFIDLIKEENIPTLFEEPEVVDFDPDRSAITTPITEDRHLTSRSSNISALLTPSTKSLEPQRDSKSRGNSPLRIDVKKPDLDERKAFAQEEIVVEGDLIISYSNGMVQKIPIVVVDK